MDKNLKQNQVGYTQATPAQNCFKKFIGITVKVCIGGVTVALCQVPAQTLIHSLDKQQLKQHSDQRESLIAVNRNLNWSSDVLQSQTQNPEKFKSTLAQQTLEPMLNNIPIYSNCWLFPWLPGCKGGGPWK